MLITDVTFPRKLRPLFEPHRFKSIRGGRDGAKSWSVARALVEVGASRKKFAVCARETMNSISDSVHRLLEQQIDLLKIAGYHIEKAKITHRGTGSEFVFKGLRHNPEAIKSLEGADILWVEEAQSVSYDSWSKAIPTIRRPNSEIWLTWNPKLESDETWQRFVVRPPPDCLDIIMNYTDNPWPSEALRAEREAMRINDPAEFEHIWLGQPRSTLAGAIYENEMRLAALENRIRRVPYDRTLPVHTAWDIGWGDTTSIWMFQVLPFAYNFIDYAEGNQKDIAEWIRILQTRPYIWGTDYMPWDAASKMFRDELVRTLKQLGRNAKILDRGDVEVGINIVRSLMPRCYWDIEKCPDGLQALRQYQYGEIKAMSDSTKKSPSRKPLHNWASHPSDAFRSFGVGVRGQVAKPKEEKAAQKRPMRRPGGGWMGLR